VWSTNKPCQSPEIVPSVLDRIRKTLVGLKMPRALEVLDQTVRQLERGETQVAINRKTTGSREVGSGSKSAVGAPSRHVRLAAANGTPEAI
jgi:hypothetical protein